MRVQFVSLCPRQNLLPLSQQIKSGQGHYQADGRGQK
jgi:hypothetical protein